MRLQTILCSLWIRYFLVQSLKGLELNFFSSKEDQEGWFVCSCKQYHQEVPF